LGETTEINIARSAEQQQQALLEVLKFDFGKTLKKGDP
jgi:hypothetical protein